jgi:hypothetical protein
MPDAELFAMERLHGPKKEWATMRQAAGTLAEGRWRPGVPSKRAGGFERVADVMDSEARMTTFLCECGNLDCVEEISLTDAAYDEVRSQDDRFAVVPREVLSRIPPVPHTGLSATA